MILMMLFMMLGSYGLGYIGRVENINTAKQRLNKEYDAWRLYN